MSGDGNGTTAGGSSDGPTGEPPKGHEHTQGENMTNGIPDAATQGSATAVPHTEREDAETAAGRGGEDPAGGDAAGGNASGG